MLDTPDITVLIKAPNQKHDDHPVQCRGTWTVQQLKGHLSENYPSKPTLREQRLIYSGQLLTDDSRLGDVLRPHADDCTVHTVHLVCAPPPAQPAEPAPAGLRHRRPQPPQQQPQPQTQQQQAAPELPTPSPMMAPTQHDLSQWAQQLQNTQHGMMAMQQAYAQYWAQYAQMMQYSPAAMPFMWPQMATAPATAAAADPAPAAAPAPAPAQAQPQPPPAAANQNVRLNARGGLMEEEEDEAGGQWDWLDWLHGMARLAVLFLAVYFYASVSRLVLVLGIGFVAYLYNQGWFQQRRPVRIPVAREPAPPREPEEPAPPREPEEQEQEREREQEREPAREPEQEQEREQQPPRADGRLRVSEELQRVMEQLGVEPPLLNRPHPFTLAWTFFTSFFASLVPDRLEQ